MDKPAGGAGAETIFLLSPARCDGERARQLLHPHARSALARGLRAPNGVPVGALFSYLSSLYFRGKLTYARAFGRPPRGLPGHLVITPGEGLVGEELLVTEARMRTWAEIPVDATNERYVAPLRVDAEALARAAGPRCRIVLLGSVATDKYVETLQAAFEDRVLFPVDFVGRGDMSRGALLLRAARTGVELIYAPVAGAARRGPRAPGVARTRA